MKFSKQNELQVQRGYNSKSKDARLMNLVMPDKKKFKSLLDIIYNNKSIKKQQFSVGRLVY